MTETFFTFMPVGLLGNPDGTLSVQASVLLRFDHVVRTLQANLQCRQLPGRPAPAAPPTFAYRIDTARAGFAVVEVTATAGWLAAWVGTQRGKGPIVDEAIYGATPAQVLARMAAIRAAYVAVLDKAKAPPAPTDLERALTILEGLDLTGHHAGFATVRAAYWGMLANPPTARDPFRQGHWFPTMLAPGPPPAVGFAWDVPRMLAMGAELDVHPITAPCRLMHYVAELGALAAYLDWS